MKAISYGRVGMDVGVVAEEAFLHPHGQPFGETATATLTGVARAGFQFHIPIRPIINVSMQFVGRNADAGEVNVFVLTDCRRIHPA